MTIPEKILNALQASFPEGAGEDQTSLANSIGDPIQEEVQRINEIDDRQSELGQVLVSDVAFMKAQILALAKNESVPLQISGSGITPNSTGSVDTSIDIINVPSGPFNPTTTNIQLAADIVARKIKAGQTKFILRKDEFGFVVENATQVALRLITFGNDGLDIQTGPGGVPIASQKVMTIKRVATTALSFLRQDGYITSYGF